jgi:sulfide:quinone oxidoreductase
MADVLILGGGFAGVVAAKALSQQLGKEHRITLISRSSRFVFYPAMVRVAFGQSEPDDVSFDVREAMLDRRVRFIEGEVARIDTAERRVILAHGEVRGELPYHYLLLALGRRLATERVTGFFEHAHELLTMRGALKFGDAIRNFRGGHAVVGQCPGARLPVPVYETAFALSRLLKDRNERERSRITIVSPDPPGLQFGDANVARALRQALDQHSIDYLPDFPIAKVTPGAVLSTNGHGLNYELLMLVPPFRGPGPIADAGITDTEGFIEVDRQMRALGANHVYAAGDCVNLPGPKLGHMAVEQAEVAAANLTAEINGQVPAAQYDHELLLVIDEGGRETIFLHQDLWQREPATVKQGWFWSWAKRIQERYWKAMHS